MAAGVKWTVRETQHLSRVGVEAFMLGSEKGRSREAVYSKWKELRPASVKRKMWTPSEIRWLMKMGADNFRDSAANVNERSEESCRMKYYEVNSRMCPMCKHDMNPKPKKPPVPRKVKMREKRGTRPENYRIEWTEEEIALLLLIGPTAFADSEFNVEHNHRTFYASSAKQKAVRKEMRENAL